MSRAAPRPPWLRAGPPTAQRVVLRGQAGAENCRAEKGAIPSLAVQIIFLSPFFMVVKHKTEHLHRFRMALSAFTALCYPPLTLFQDLPMSPLNSSRPAGLLATLCVCEFGDSYEWNHTVHVFCV